MPQDKNVKSVYINKELHKKIKLHCIKHDIGSMKEWMEKILEVAVVKPKASERLQKLADEAAEDGCVVLHEVEEPTHSVELGASTKLSKKDESEPESYKATGGIVII